MTTRLIVLPCLLLAIWSRAATALPSDEELAAKYPRVMTVEQARQYVLDLINRDRASVNLQPVTLDDGPATVAAQRHADDMDKSDYMAHRGTDGSWPYQRYSEAGGADFCVENVAHWRDISSAPLKAEIRAAPLAELERNMFNETPPADGHRRNILNPWRRTVGLGIATRTWRGHDGKYKHGLWLDQEFVNVYGKYDSIPQQIHAGESVTVAGTLDTPAIITNVGLSRLDLPAPMTVEELEKTKSYSEPHTYRTFGPRGKKHPVAVDGQHFTITVVLGDDHPPGLYALSVWAKFPGQDEEVLVSMRTIVVG